MLQSLALAKDTGHRAESEARSYNAGLAADVFAELRVAMCDSKGRIVELDNPITWEEVHSIIRRLPNGKAAGPDASLMKF